MLPENLARLRKGTGLSQAELAEASGVALDTIARTERGEQTPRPATVAKLAAALDVTADQLRGGLVGTGVIEDSKLIGLRRAITATENIPGLTDFAENDDVLTPTAIGAAVHTAWRSYVDGQHDDLLRDLPVLLNDVRRLHHVATGDEKASAHRYLSAAYRLSAGLAGRFDLTDLAWNAAERALEAARHTDEPALDRAVSMRYLVWTLVRQGRHEEAERVALRTAAEIEPRMLDRDPRRAGIFGNLVFNAASAAQRNGNTATADDLLILARSTAVRSGRDIATEEAIFGPRVADLQRIDHTVRTGDPERALELAAIITQPHGVVPAFWEAGHRLHLAHAAAQLHRNDLALTLLAEARGLAPSWVQQQPLGTTVMTQLVDRATRKRTKTFAALARHYGVLPPP